MNAGFWYALLPALLSPVFRGLAAVLELDWPGITPPLPALLRSLPALALFWGWSREDFQRPLLLPLYGAYAGAVLDERGVFGALAGALLGLLLQPFRRVARRHRFWAALLYVALAAFLFTAGLILLGVETGWILPLVLLLAGFLDPALPGAASD